MLMLMKWLIVWGIKRKLIGKKRLREEEIKQLLEDSSECSSDKDFDAATINSDTSGEMSSVAVRCSWKHLPAQRPRQQNEQVYSEAWDIQLLQQ